MVPQVDSEDYNALVEKQIPVAFYYGDYIGEEFTDVPAAGMWAMMSSSADAFTEGYTAAGLTSTVVHLPEEGITGNSHFLLQELNNDVIAEHVEAWIQGGTGENNTSRPVSLAAASESGTEGGKTLVAYYSATGHTAAVAETIAQARSGGLFEIIPAEPCSSDDLNWRDSGSRVSREHEDESLREMELVSSTVENWDEYDTVFLGYPIWRGIAAWPVDAFAKANDFTGKTVVPFCTSSSSGLGQSGVLLKELANVGDWLEGQRFSSGASAATVSEWVNGLDLPAAAPAVVETVRPSQQEGRTLVEYFSHSESGAERKAAGRPDHLPESHPGRGAGDRGLGDGSGRLI